MKQGAEELLQEIERIAVEAGRLVLQMGADRVSLKSDQSVVTAADRKCERFLREKLSGLLAGAVWLGEESWDQEEVCRTALDAEWVWAVDPIDGTAAFIDQLPTWTVSVGLLRRGRPWAGVLVLPVAERVWSAVRGGGLRSGDHQVRVRQQTPAADLRTLYVPSNAHRFWELGWDGKTRSLGSTALHLGLVAAGCGCGAFGSGHIWDLAAAVAMVEAAGGEVVHLDGSPVDWAPGLLGKRVRTVLAAPPALIEPLRMSIRRRD